MGAGLTTGEIEKLALEEVLKERPPEGLEERLPEVIALLQKLKDLVARGAPPEDILEALETSNLPAEMMRELEKSLL